jgi:uncharacterized Tic20 family protein
MNDLGNKIRELRKKKGLSQEELAELAGINLRTIQRIENNESEPRGNTLHLICKALDVNAEELLDYGKQTDNGYLTLLHLSVLSGYIIPIGNIVIPMILWLVKKDKIVGLNEAGINLVNFQINYTAILFLSFAVIIVSRSTSFSVILLLICLLGINLILPIRCALKLRNGEAGRYPTLIRIIK